MTNETSSAEVAPLPERIRSALRELEQGPSRFRLRSSLLSEDFALALVEYGGKVVALHSGGITYDGPGRCATCPGYPANPCPQLSALAVLLGVE